MNINIAHEFPMATDWKSTQSTELNALQMINGLLNEECGDLGNPGNLIRYQTSQIECMSGVISKRCSAHAILEIKTRWTFFRVKLVFEFEFEISWSLGPLDLGSSGPWDSWTFSLLQHLLILPHTSYYLLLSLPLVWFGYGGGNELWHWRMRLEIDLWPLYWSWKVVGWVGGTSSFLLHSLPLTPSHLLLIPPSYSSLLPNLLLTPPSSSWRLSDD